jgi:hypothetical protein
MACGAPFAVHHFLQNRREKGFHTILLKSFLTVFVWIPYAVRLLHSHWKKKFTGRQFAVDAAADATLQNKLEQLQKEIWRSVPNERNRDVSLFEFREVLDRYAGLTLALKERAAVTFETEIFGAANHPDKNLGAKCLLRRNRSRLEFHQTLASRDFLKLLSRLCLEDSEKLRFSAIEFVKILEDAETLRAIENLPGADSAQSSKPFAVEETENEVWNTDRHKPLPTRPISVNLTSSLNPKTALSKRD